METLQATDLRIKNLVEYNGRIFEIDTIAKEFPTLNTQEFGIGVVDWNNIKPIPLTEDWLLKFGWVWNEECKSYEKHPNGDIRMNLQYRDLSNSYTMFNYVLKALIAERIFYVHQLQNLYFALTNKELEIQ